MYFNPMSTIDIEEFSILQKLFIIFLMVIEMYINVKLFQNYLIMK